jgi:uncharacterized protein
MDDLPKAAPPARSCAICGKPVQARFRPFCSARCRMIDLGRWIDGGYRVPSEEPPTEDPDEEG